MRNALVLLASVAALVLLLLLPAASARADGSAFTVAALALACALGAAILRRFHPNS